MFRYPSPTCLSVYIEYVDKSSGRILTFNGRKGNDYHQIRFIPKIVESKEPTQNLLVRVRETPLPNYTGERERKDRIKRRVNPQKRRSRPLDWVRISILRCINFVDIVNSRLDPY